MSSYQLEYLQYLETEAIHVMREVAGEFERPALLFSGGKDSLVSIEALRQARASLPKDWPAQAIDLEKALRLLTGPGIRRQLAQGAEPDDPAGCNRAEFLTRLPAIRVRRPATVRIASHVTSC